MDAKGSSVCVACMIDDYVCQYLMATEEKGFEYLQHVKDRVCHYGLDNVSNQQCLDAQDTRLIRL